MTICPPSGKFFFKSNFHLSSRSGSPALFRVPSYLDGLSASPHDIPGLLINQEVLELGQKKKKSPLGKVNEHVIDLWLKISDGLLRPNKEHKFINYNR